MNINCPLCGSESDYTFSGKSITVKCKNADCRIKRTSKWLRMPKEEAVKNALEFWIYKSDKSEELLKWIRNPNEAIGSNSEFIYKTNKKIDLYFEDRK